MESFIAINLIITSNDVCTFLKKDSMVNCRFKAEDWVQIEDRALGLKAIGKVIGIVADSNGNAYYQIDWKINQCTKTQGIQPTSLYPLIDFDKKGCLAANAMVLYGLPKKDL